MKFYWGPGHIQDGKLDHTCGRIIIFEDHIMVGRNRAMDHNYLLRALAARDKLNKDDVISNALRFYYKQENNEIIISPVRKLDEDQFERKLEFYAKLIKNNFK